MPNREEKTFHIGIAMAGAVSAGAYTGGVIDYLLQTLDSWEKAKANNRAIEAEFGRDESKGYDPTLPMHDVVIDVIGGASAGGITAALTALTLMEGFHAARPEKPNKLYDSWVNLNDQNGTSTLEQMFSLQDLLLSPGGVPSLLNSDPIEQISKRALALKGQRELPSYISPNLEVILTLTSLRGIPLHVNFFDIVKTEAQKRGIDPLKPAHTMKLHKGVAHFRMHADESAPDHVLPLDPANEEHRQALIESAIASGAFPLGLRPRLIKGTSLKYINGMIKRMFRLEGEERGYFELGTRSDPFDFIAIDGGTINNEPFGEIIAVLEEKCKPKGEDYAIIMIDPFPNFEEDNEAPAYDKLPPMAGLVPGIIGAIRGQAMMKENEVVRGFSNDFTRRMIFPKRGQDPYPISCGALDGFSGFFKREFREHDFQLGRKNCQSFLRKYFGIKKDEAAEVRIYDEMPRGAANPHARFVKRGEDSQNYLPIIPDVRSGIGQTEDATEIQTPERVPIRTSEVMALQPGIQKRLHGILVHGVGSVTRAKDGHRSEEDLWVSNRMLRYFNKKEEPSRLFSWVKSTSLWIWRKWLANIAAKQLSYSVLETILKDFRKRGLVED